MQLLFLEITSFIWFFLITLPILSFLSKVYLIVPTVHFAYILQRKR